MPVCKIWVGNKYNKNRMIPAFVETEIDFKNSENVKWVKSFIF